MPGLILEGGTFRPIFSCGVMDALLDNDLMFDYVIGVSAGIADGVSYLSRQRGRNLDIVVQYRNDSRYMGVSNFARCGSLFGLDFVYGEIPDRLIPFDWDAFRKYPGRAYVVVTNAKTGKPEYLDTRYMDGKFTMLRATCALPLLFPAIRIGANEYFDGGLCDSIPIRRALADGSQRNLIVLTRPEGYRKELTRGNKLAAARIRKKYPALVDPLLNRHTMYNEQVDFCEKLAREDPANTVLIRPEVSYDSFEKNVETLKKMWQDGYDMAQSRMAEIRTLFV